MTGLSVAVGIGGNIVWAEGFGWAGERVAAYIDDLANAAGHASLFLRITEGFTLRNTMQRCGQTIQKFFSACVRRRMRLNTDAHQL